MSKGIRTIVTLAVSLLLFSALVIAEPAKNDADKDKNKEHHSRLAKVAFWRHGKDADKKAKPAQTPSSHAKSEQVKSVPSKGPKTAQAKAVSPKQSGKKDKKDGAKQVPHAANVSKVSSKKTQVASKTNSSQKAPIANKAKSNQKAPLASNSKPTQKTQVGNKTKSNHKAQEPKTVSLKQ
jgi:hypothetical protein